MATFYPIKWGPRKAQSGFMGRGAISPKKSEILREKNEQKPRTELRRRTLLFSKLKADRNVSLFDLCKI